MQFATICPTNLCFQGSEPKEKCQCCSSNAWVLFSRRFRSNEIVEPPKMGVVKGGASYLHNNHLFHMFSSFSNHRY